MVEVFRKLFGLLSSGQQKRFAILSMFMVFVALAEVFGLSSILVLLNVLSNPEAIADSKTLSFAYQSFGFETIFEFQIFLSTVAFFVVLVAQVIKTLGAYAVIRFSFWRGFSISTELLRSYLSQPYTWFIQVNSSEISKNVLNEVTALVNFVIIPSLRLLSNIILVFCILVFLFTINYMVTLVALSVIGGSYTLTYFALRNTLYQQGERALQGNQGRFRVVQEAMEGFKEIKFRGLEKLYIRRFSDVASEFADGLARSRILSETPRFVMEALVFALIILSVLIVLFQNNGDISVAVPLIGVFGFSVIKLLPAMQQVYQGLAHIRTGKPYLDIIYKDYSEIKAKNLTGAVNAGTTSRLPFTQDLEIKHIDFTFPNHTRAALQGLSLCIPAHSTVGIVGGSGAGKTTLVDLMLGLLTPQSGQILVDGTPVTEDNLQSWRQCIGYVPQSIYLTDSTVAENIGFGVSPDDIDMEAVERAAKLAALHEFIMAELPEGYETQVGERGVRLSGGQRQRIGIARALYHDPDLLILDEATSALDNLTEQAVMDAIHNIGQEKTIILIAHRLSTVADCDRIFLLEKGRVLSEGTYDELLENSDMFRQMTSGKTENASPG